MTPGQDKHTHPYLKEKFYTLHWFSERTCYPEFVREEYRYRERMEQKRIDRKKKADSVIWQLPH